MAGRGTDRAAAAGEDQRNWQFCRRCSPFASGRQSSSRTAIASFTTSSRSRMGRSSIRPVSRRRRQVRALRSNGGQPPVLQHPSEDGRRISSPLTRPRTSPRRTSAARFASRSPPGAYTYYAWRAGGRPDEGDRQGRTGDRSRDRLAMRRFLVIVAFVRLRQHVHSRAGRVDEVSARRCVTDRFSAAHCRDGVRRHIVDPLVRRSLVGRVDGPQSDAFGGRIRMEAVWK